MLLYVVDSKGSSPGRRGFCMAVNNEHIMQGSIGGGMMEHKLIELAKSRLGNDAAFSLLKPQYHKKDAIENRSGMICSGKQYVYMHLFNEDEINLVTSIIHTIETKSKGTLTIKNGEICFHAGDHQASPQFHYCSETEFIYNETFVPPAKLHIIGGGHCSVSLSQLMDIVGFEIAVYDDRKDLQTMLENSFADEKRVLTSYEDLSRSDIAINDGDYVVIMTFGYRTDKVALKALLDRPVKYLGMLGSRNKIDELFKELMDEGIEAEKLDKVCTPIGLKIFCKTPEEIAVSIAAEIILKKNKPH